VASLLSQAWLIAPALPIEGEEACAAVEDLEARISGRRCKGQRGLDALVDAIGVAVPLTERVVALYRLGVGGSMGIDRLVVSAQGGLNNPLVLNYVGLLEVGVPGSRGIVGAAEIAEDDRKNVATSGSIA
jgi:hypothetical protein